MQKSCIITGVTGQDGSILSEQLLGRGYKVYGLVRRRSDSPNLGCSAHLENEPDFEIIEGDLTDLPSLIRLCNLARADYFYNLAAMSHVGTSFSQPEATAQVTALGVLNCLEAIRTSGLHTRFYQASTSELFGGLSEEPFNEESLLHPRSPYGVAKLYGYWITKNYRESYKMFASNGILFNHEEPGKRGPNFVTRKISLAVAKIQAGKQKKLYLGNLEAKRDWGLASDFCFGMSLILEHSEPDDFVLATGESHSVKEFCEIAFSHAGLGNYSSYVEVDPRFYRPAEVHVLLGDPSKAKNVLGWTPKTSFTDLVKKMVDYDLDLVNGRECPSELL